MARRTSPYPPLSVKSYSHHAPNDFGLTQFDQNEIGVSTARRVTTTGGVNGRKRKSFGKTTEQKKELKEARKAGRRAKSNITSNNNNNTTTSTSSRGRGRTRNNVDMEGKDIDYCSRTNNHDDDDNSELISSPEKENMKHDEEEELDSVNNMPSPKKLNDEMTDVDSDAVEDEDFDSDVTKSLNDLDDDMDFGGTNDFHVEEELELEDAMKMNQAGEESTRAGGRGDKNNERDESGYESSGDESELGQKRLFQSSNKKRRVIKEEESGDEEASGKEDDNKFCICPSLFPSSLHPSSNPPPPSIFIYSFMPNNFWFIHYQGRSQMGI